MGSNAEKRVAAGVLSTSWVFEPSEHPEDKINYCTQINPLEASDEVPR